LGELMGSINGKDLFHLKNRIKNQSAEPHKEADGGMER